MAKIRLWLYNRILEPKFDDPDAAMPRPSLTEPQARAIADYLSGVPVETGEAVQGRGAIRRFTGAVSKLARPVENRLPYPTRENAKKYLASLYVIGFVTGVLLLAFAIWLLAYYRRKRNGGASG